MMNLAATIQGVVDLLNSVEGLSATSDLRDLNTDCILVQMDSISHEYLCGSGEVTITLYLVTANVGMPQDLVSLSDMLDKVLTVLSPDTDTKVGTVPPLEGGDPLPALVVTVKVPTQ